MRRNKKRKIKNAIFLIFVEIFIIALVIFFIELDKEKDGVYIVANKIQSCLRNLKNS